MSTDDLVRRALTALADADASRGAPPQLEREVLNAFDRRPPRGFVRRSASTVWTYRYEMLGSATAAVVALILFVQLRAPQSAPALAHRDPSTSAIDIVEVNEPPLFAPSPTMVPARPPARGRRVRSVVDRVAPTGMDIRDVVHAVHVQVPRTMLPLLGIPVIDPDAPGSVNVEFLLGHDGLARTIRIRP